jgi:hypothetical protein
MRAMNKLITRESLRYTLLVLVFAVAYEAIGSLPGLYRKYDARKLLETNTEQATTPADAPYSKAEVVRSVTARSQAELIERVKMYGYVDQVALVLKLLLAIAFGTLLARLAGRRTGP